MCFSGAESVLINGNYEHGKGERRMQVAESKKAAWRQKDVKETKVSAFTFPLLLLRCQTVNSPFAFLMFIVRRVMPNNNLGTRGAQHIANC